MYTEDALLDFLKDNNLLDKKIYCDCIDCLANYISFQKKIFHGRLNLQRLCIDFGYGAVVNSIPLFLIKYDCIIITSVNPLMIASKNRFFILYTEE